MPSQTGASDSRIPVPLDSSATTPAGLPSAVSSLCTAATNGARSATGTLIPSCRQVENELSGSFIGDTSLSGVPLPLRWATTRAR